MDAYISNLIYGLRTPALDGVMLFITYLGDWQVVLALALITCAALAFKKKWLYIAAILFATGGGEALVWLIKNFVRRPRPLADGALITETSFSFPSGHAFIGIAFYGLLIYFLLRRIKNRSGKTALIAAGALLAFAIGYSRIYLGVHWPTDVLAGLMLGAAWLAVTVKVLKFNAKRRAKDK